MSLSVLRISFLQSSLLRPSSGAAEWVDSGGYPRLLEKEVKHSLVCIDGIGVEAMYVRGYWVSIKGLKVVELYAIRSALSCCATPKITGGKSRGF